MKYLVDTCVWVSLFVSNDCNHKKAVALFEILQGEEIGITISVIHESANILLKRGNKTISEQFLQYIIYNTSIRQIDENIEETYQLYKDINIKISFTDISLIATSKSKDYKVATFDEQLITLYKKLL